MDVKFAQIVESKPGRSAGFGFAAFHSSNDMGMAIDRFSGDWSFAQYLKF